MVYCAESLFPPPALAADLLLMNKVAWGCHLPRGVSSPCTIGLIFWVFFVQPACPALLVGAVSSVHAFSGKASQQKRFSAEGLCLLPPSWKEKGEAVPDPDTV